MQLVKHLKGHSGANVSLYCDGSAQYVIKDNYVKARESVALLNNLPFYTPEVYEVTNDRIVMEYLNGIDMKTYLFNADNASIDKLINFISSYIDYCISVSVKYDFVNEIQEKKTNLKRYIDLSELSFNTKLPQSIIHGDFTLDNIMYYKDKFYLIDANPTELNSIYFDINKLCQDLDCLWFVRNETNKLHFKLICTKIKQQLLSKYPDIFDNNIIIFMLSRILPYTTDDKTRNFLTKEIDKLWL